MRFRVCCCFDDAAAIEKVRKSRLRKGTVIEIQTGPPLTEQPRRGESIELSRIERLSSETSARERETSPATREINSPPPPTVSETSNFTYIARNGEKSEMTFDQVAPEVCRGAYKGHEFTIANGEIQSANGALNQMDELLIRKNHSQAALALQQGLLGIEARLLGSLNQEHQPLTLQQLTERNMAPGAKVNVNFKADNGEKLKMTFKQVKLGLFRGTCNDKKFSIANGQVLTLHGAESGMNKELILSVFHRALLGMQQTSIGLEQSALAIEARLSGNQSNPMELLKAACPERRNAFQEESLQVHNEFRQVHGVPPLTHSEFLCELAREWAEHLALKDTSYYRPNNDYGENLFYSHGAPLDARKAITTWYDEINLYNYTDPQCSKETGHFTQLVWRDTREMGTGIAQLGDKVWVCCYYHPPGNVASRLTEEQVPRPVEAT